METILEQQRRYHEERERLIKLMVDEYVTKKVSDRDRIYSEHRLKALLELYITGTGSLRELYEDKDGERKHEVAALSGPNEFSEFYARLKQIKEFYKRHPNEISVPLSVEFEELGKSYGGGQAAAGGESNSGSGNANPGAGSGSASSAASAAVNASASGSSAAPSADDLAHLVAFTDEEGCGRYLDLHECYVRYLNIRGAERLDYITYLTRFDHVFDIPRDRKNIAYSQYLGGLLDYLADYVARIRPLLDLDAELGDVRRAFAGQWTAGTFAGWPRDQRQDGGGTGGSSLAATGAHLDLSAFGSWEELASLGLDRLKSALMALGVKCGGTLEERAQRLFSTKGMQRIEPQLVARNKDADGRGAQREQARWREVAEMEAQLYRLAELVSEQRAATKENVQRKQARTEAEREDSDADASDTDDDDADGDDVPYNPKNLPLGWDGKPIPYWLYKLHGLNISYSCEICGNYTYKGPKAFQRHFAEWRHAHGMRCLGIPNTAHFANVTQIEDAITLWEKLKTQKQGERWIPEAEEEFEDSLGNVVNKKTFEDLKRQGLL